MKKTFEMRAAKTMTEFAGEPVTVAFTGSVLYGFASELGCLRIFAKYHGNGATPNPKVRVGYSENLGTWYVSIET